MWIGEAGQLHVDVLKKLESTGILWLLDGVFVPEFRLTNQSPLTSCSSHAKKLAFLTKVSSLEGIKSGNILPI